MVNVVTQENIRNHLEISLAPFVISFVGIDYHTSRLSWSTIQKKRENFSTKDYIATDTHTLPGDFERLMKYLHDGTMWSQRAKKHVKNMKVYSVQALDTLQKSSTTFTLKL